jgi:RHS repeat-associated protein
MEWSARDQLRRVVMIERTGGDPDDDELYDYAADGQRVRKVTNRLVSGNVEATETIYLDGCEVRRIKQASTQILERWSSNVADDSGRLATIYRWTEDDLNRETGSGSSFPLYKQRLHLTTHQDSTSMELDEDGGVVAYEEYFPYGGTAFVAGDSALDAGYRTFRFVGKDQDDSTGFYVFQFRYYAPFLGNWVSPDPGGEIDGPNQYWYVRNNPVSRIDALGMLAGPPQLLHDDAVGTRGAGAAGDRLLQRDVPSGADGTGQGVPPRPEGDVADRAHDRGETGGSREHHPAPGGSGHRPVRPAGGPSTAPSVSDSADGAPEVPNPLILPGGDSVPAPISDGTDGPPQVADDRGPESPIELPAGLPSESPYQQIRPGSLRDALRQAGRDRHGDTSPTHAPADGGAEVIAGHEGGADVPEYLSLEQLAPQQEDPPEPGEYFATLIGRAGNNILSIPSSAVALVTHVFEQTSRDIEDIENRGSDTTFTWPVLLLLDGLVAFLEGVGATVDAIEGAIRTGDAEDAGDVLALALTIGGAGILREVVAASPLAESPSELGSRLRLGPGDILEDQRGGVPGRGKTRIAREIRQQTGDIDAPRGRVDVSSEGAREGTGGVREGTGVERGEPAPAEAPTWSTLTRRAFWDALERVRGWAPHERDRK